MKNRKAVRFEFKWSEDEDAEMHGPFLAEEMLAWQQGNYFGDGVWVRQVNKVRPSAALEWAVVLAGGWAGLHGGPGLAGGGHILPQQQNRF
jgi:hypothetical protein